MATISIDLDSVKKEIYLTGDINSLKNHRWAWRYLKDYLKPVVSGEQGMITIPIPEDTDEIRVLNSVRSMLIKYGFTEKRSESSNQVLKDFYLEEEKFKEFSKKALQIRNNNCDRDEFKDFTDAVSSHLITRTLYPLQLLSAFHMAFSQNSCNFSVPGAGKTSIVYGAYAYLSNIEEKNPKKIDKLLIVGPLSSFGPWEMEYMECFGVKPSVKRLIGGVSLSEKRDYLYSNNPCEITLTSYSSLINLIEDIEYFLKNNRVMVVLDEAHKAKNSSGGIIAQTVLHLSKFSKSRIVLTGTPAPNGYQDLYNMLKFIWPTKNIIGYEVNQLIDISSKQFDSRVDTLIERISPYFIRIKKSDLDIPPATIHPPINVPMGKVQQQIYDFIESKYMSLMIKGGAYSDSISNFKSVIVKARMIRLMQAATDPAMLIKPLTEFIDEDGYPDEAERAVDDSEIMKYILNYSEIEVPTKYIETKRLVNKILSTGGKVVIWATFIHTIKELQKHLEKNGIKTQVLYGEIPVEKDRNIYNNDYEDDILTREKIVEEFQNEHCPYKVIIANPFAVAESISLHKACHNAIYIERSFNAAHFVQSKDRIHRYGLQADTVTNYYFILSENTIDETIDERLSLKEKRMVELMENMPIPLFNNISEDLGDEDIKVLIKNYVRKTKKY